MRITFRPRTITGAAALAMAAAGVLAIEMSVPSRPAHAFVVFDPSNYGQNLLTAARTLQQINNQIRSLQNEAQSLINQAKNLETIGFPELEAITQTLQQVDVLMGQAQGIRFRIASLDEQYRRLYPEGFDKALSLEGHVLAARERLETAMAAYRRTMGVQAQIVENVAADARILDAIAARSQNARGALQVGQATNQLLALTAKQQFQIQQLMAAQYRADAVREANREQARIDARAATRKFLGSGSAYSSD
ncbi:conjugal transfer protein TrbJ [Novosphingobium endophyticum]|uniref:Conjugal transfer protein TrbJ n=1 Tax=Novosphingobium endophyticum TaxID=1955250 RepID=A0A916X5Y3_9SPHN|nr:P-type conjugative transfer protein TrbJ [Novosphingobium endophyticum]GGC04670.1 conjugal transfer protein TrbJ [Novosphingobium endophyticum]